MSSSQGMGTEVLCYNKGCGQSFDPSKNANDSCTYHPGVPVFHDAYKSWSCCNKKTTDFTEFLNIKGCTIGPHSNVKPEEPPKAPVSELGNESKNEIYTYEAPKPKKPSMVRPSFDTPLVKLPFTIGSSLKPLLDKLNDEPTKEKDDLDDENKEIPIGTPCKNATCKETYQGESASESLCTYHPGVAIFHEGMKYWSCCARKTSDFENFLSQVGCTTGKHLWRKKNDGSQPSKPACRHDWHQTGNTVVVSIYSKLPLPHLSLVEANPVRLLVAIVFGQEKIPFDMDMELFGVIEPEESSVTYLSTKVEIKLKKAEPMAWKKLAIPPPIKDEADQSAELSNKMDDFGINS